MKEAVTNIAKHSDGTQVNVLILTRRKKQLHLVISDNGQAYSPKQPSGQGLANMASRARSIHGTLRTWHHQGFHVELLVPL